MMTGPRLKYAGKTDPSEIERTIQYKKTAGCV